MADRDVRVVASGGQPPRRTPAWLPAALATLAALIIGLLVGRATAPDDSGSRPRDNQGNGIPGPSRIQAGVDVGYPRTREGAVAALLNDGAALGDPRTLLDPARRRTVLRLVATDRYAQTFEGRGAAALERARQGPLGRGLASGARTVYLASPIAYRVLSYGASRARVEGWGVAVIGNDQGVEPRATWATTTTDAVWQDGDWKVDAVSTSDGPTPALARGTMPTGVSEFLNRLAGAHGVRHVP